MAEVIEGGSTVATGANTGSDTGATASTSTAPSTSPASTEQSAVEKVAQSTLIEKGVASIAKDLGFAKKPAENKQASTTPAGTTTPTVTEQTPEQKAAAEAATAAAATGTQTPAAQAAPKTWTKEAASAWEQVPPAAKAEILRREEDMFKGIETYKTKANFGQSIENILAPYKGLMEQHRMEPVSTINNLLAAHHTLAMGTPEQKQALMANLMKSYGVTMPGAAGEEGSAAYVDPKVAELEARLAQQEQQARTREQQEYAAAHQKATENVAAFAADPAHPYFEEVGTDIAMLIKTGQAKDLADAYNKAIYMNPVTRSKEIARLDAEKQAKLTSDAAKKAEEARAATAANVQTRAKSSTAAEPLGTMEDTMKETLARMKNS